MVAVKTGALTAPMGGMPMGGAQQPMNMMPPPMPVPPINPNMQFGQQPVGALPPHAAGTFPVSADRRKRFGDSLETMLASRRPPSPVASDQMAGMNVFTGQMMNTARPPVAQMRNGGIVRNMRRGGSSFADYAHDPNPMFDIYSPPKPSKPTVSRASQIVANQIAQAQRDDRPAPVKMSFSDDDYTPTSAELNEQMEDLAAIGMPDLRQDQSDVYMPQYPDLLDRTRDTINDYSAYHAMVNKYGTQGTPEDRATILAPGTGGLSSVPSTPSVPVGSGMNPSNVYVDPLDPFGGPGPDISISPPDPRSYVGSGMNPLTAYGPTSPDAFIGTGPDISAPKNYVGSGANPLTAYGPTSSDAFLGTGDPLDLGIGETSLRPRIRPEGGGQTGTGTGEEDDRGFVEKFKDDVKNFGSSLIKDLQMAADAGFFGGYGTMEKRLLEAKNPDGSLKYTPDEVTDYIRRTKETQANQLKNQQNQSTDDDSPMSTSPVNPCPAGMRLDPVAGICVPVEEGEDEGPSLDLNRSRDDEFNELDDIMKKVVKPVDEDVRTMQAGGSVGLNRAADNFLAAMGG